MEYIRQKAWKGMPKISQWLVSIVILTGLLMTPILVLAVDGVIFRKNVSKTPDLETEFAAIRTLPLNYARFTQPGLVPMDYVDYGNQA